MIKTALKITNQASGYIERQNRRASRAHSRALVRTGFKLRTSVKEGMLKEAPAGEPWTPTHPWTKYNLLGRARRSYRRSAQRGSRRRGIRSISITGKPTTALRRIAQATRYQKWITSGRKGTVAHTRVKVGFLNRSAARIAAYHATGPHFISATSKMRRFIYASGLILGANRIRVPRRPHVEKVLRRNRRIIPVFVNRQVDATMAGKDPRTVDMRFR